MKTKDELQRETEREKKRLDMIVSLSSDLIFEYDIATDTMHFYNGNEEAGRKDVIADYNTYVRETHLVYEENREILEEFYHQLREGREHIQLEFRKIYRDGCYHWFEIKAGTIADAEGRPEKVIGKIGLADEQNRYRNVLIHRMERDILTGLYNRETIEKLIRERLKSETASTNDYLVIVDVSDFREEYEKQGSLLSDAVFCTFADELQILFADNNIGRIGENEFVIYLQNTSFEKLEENRKLLNMHIRRIYGSAVKRLTPVCRMGASAFKQESTYEELLRQAQSALQYAKEEGGIWIYQENRMPLQPPKDMIPVREVLEGSFNSTDGDLVLFAIELFENVKDVRSVLRVLSDRICKFYKLEDIVYLVCSKQEEPYITYYWGSVHRDEYDKVSIDMRQQEWDVLLKQYDREGISVLREADLVQGKDTDVKSVLGIRLAEDMQIHYMLFVDRKQDRSWQQERIGLRRLAWIMHKRLQQMEEKQRELKRTNYIIEHDDKTDLYNYTKFLAVAERILKENSGRKYALIYSDFSNFQFLNETYGYVTGDKILIDFAYFLKENCSHGVLYSRVTGDHFISMHECKEGVDLAGQYVQVCNAFCDKVNKKYNLCNLILISGMSMIDDPKVKVAVYVDNANIARKTVKKNTVTGLCVFSEDMRLVSTRQMELAANMEKALEQGEFVMYLQPKVNLVEGTISGAEALVRWIKEDGTMVYPDEFIPLFEKNGFITKIDFEMLRQVLILQREQMQKGRKLLPISVNFSRRHQENPNYVEEVSRMMEEYQVPSEYVEIEVTESVFMDDFTVLNQNISKLKKTGVGIAIDDFGSGYSSLNVLSKVDADVIKLDRQFLLDMESDSEEVKKNFLNTLVLMIKQLGFTVLAEGVETPEQEEILKNTGCDYAQGYLYAKPMRTEEFLEFAKAYGRNDD